MKQWCYRLVLLLPSPCCRLVLRLLAQDSDSCVLTVCCGVPQVFFQCSILQLSLGIQLRRFISSIFSFFSHGFLRPEPILDLYETNENAACQTRTCDTCAHPYIPYAYIYPGMMYDTIKYYGSVAACSGNTSIDSVYFCPCARTRYILYRTYFATTKSNSSSSAQLAASLICCYLLYAVYRSVDSSVLLRLDL